MRPPTGAHFRRRSHWRGAPTAPDPSAALAHSPRRGIRHIALPDETTVGPSSTSTASSRSSTTASAVTIRRWRRHSHSAARTFPSERAHASVILAMISSLSSSPIPTTRRYRCSLCATSADPSPTFPTIRVTSRSQTLQPRSTSSPWKASHARSQRWASPRSASLSSFCGR